MGLASALLNQWREVERGFGTSRIILVSAFNAALIGASRMIYALAVLNDHIVEALGDYLTPIFSVVIGHVF